MEDTVEQEGKTVDESRTEMVEVVLPNDANSLGNILGGKVMHLIDIAGAIAAHRHSRSIVVTASIDNLDFIYPIQIGQLIILQSVVTAAFNTSMEVKVDVYSEDILNGERKHTSTAFLTFVALDAARHHKGVPKLILRTEEERQLYQDAVKRREERLRRKRKRKT
jgi:acyl-CoA hydrolase